MEYLIVLFSVRCYVNDTGSSLRHGGLIQHDSLHQYEQQKWTGELNNVIQFFNNLKLMN